MLLTQHLLTPLSLGIVCGYLSDLYGGRRACVCATMMLVLVPLLLFLGFFMVMTRAEYVLERRLSSNIIQSEKVGFCGCGCIDEVWGAVCVTVL